MFVRALVCLFVIGSADLCSIAYAADPSGKLPERNTAEERKTLRLGDFGELVEGLQRTLNARVRPSPGLSIDGDFGSMTQAALIGFQRQRKLVESGVVDRSTWQALSPLLLEAEPVPEPDVINAEVLPRDAPDAQTGRPWVTCKAWGVFDPNTHTLVGGVNLDLPLPIASTTKIMTALLVVRHTASHPEVLEETVTFSKRADQTRGSTSGIREGESASVLECLYGLLLPSGNDAAVALAEHFGERLAPDGSPANVDEQRDPLPLFIHAMNRQAKSMKLEQTSFANPNGLHHEDHHSSVGDLLILTTDALSFPLFQELVSTRQRGCAVTGTGGYRRNLHWKNSNVLLGTEGYVGVKTGTTEAAGACLVALAQRGGEERLLVLLGSASSQARYVDARNLFRWSWQKPVQEEVSKP